MNEFHEIGHALFERHKVEAEDHWDYYDITGCKCNPNCEKDDHLDHYLYNIEVMVREEVEELHEAYQKDFPDYIFPVKNDLSLNVTYFSCSSRTRRLWAIYFGAQDRERAIKIIAPQVVDHLSVDISVISDQTEVQHEVVANA